LNLKRIFDLNEVMVVMPFDESPNDPKTADTETTEDIPIQIHIDCWTTQI
jgi:hypothetical protein